MAAPVDLLFFCDESSQISDEWCAVAGLVMPRRVAADATSHLKGVKARLKRPGEVKWSKAKSFGGRIHREFIDYLFDQIDAGRMHFHIRFSPMNEYDHKLSGPRKRIDTVSKSFYQLLHHRAVKLYHMHRLHIVPDDGDCTSLLPDLIGPLNAVARRECGQTHGCIQSISPRSSASEPMLELLDVTLGALSALRNGRHNSLTAGVKRELAQHAFARTGWPLITGNCPVGSRELSRWNVVPKLKIGGRGPQS